MSGVPDSNGRMWCDICSIHFDYPPHQTVYARCPGCALELAKIGPPSGAVTNEYPSTPNRRGTFLARAQWRYARKWLGGRDLVDVGCGTGQFLMTARNIGNMPDRVAYGVEIDAMSTATARASGLEIRSSIDANTSNSLFTLWHSAEHFPVGMLIELLRQIAVHSDNRVIIAVPNADYWGSKMFPEVCAFYDPEHHYTQFNLTSINALLDKTGLQLIKVGRIPVYGLFSAFQTTLNLRLPRNYLHEKMRRRGEQINWKEIVQSGFAIAMGLPRMIKLLVAEITPRTSACLVIVAAPRKS